MNSIDSKTKKKLVVGNNFEALGFDYLIYQADNLTDYSNQICQNWLKTHETQFLHSKNIQRFAKIVILLQDISELIEKINLTIKYAKLQKQEVHEKICTIVAKCLDIEQNQIVSTANFTSNLGIDSLEWQELLTNVEDTFAVKISDEIAETLVTVQQLTDRTVMMIKAQK